MNSQSKQSEPLTKDLVLIAIFRFIIITALLIGIFWLASGRLDWWELWAYLANYLIVVVVGRVYLMVKDPDLIRERMQAGKKEDVKPWDKWLVLLVAVYLPMISWMFAGLDKRFGWTPDLPDWVQLIALGFLFLSGMLGNWAMMTNRFFSSHVRIQSDRGQHVVDQGMYSVVRHPGYASGLLAWIAAPVFFSSWPVAIPCAVTIVLYVYRTKKEDRALQEELPGYKEYAQRVRYRLVPGIW